MSSSIKKREANEFELNDLDDLELLDVSHSRSVPRSSYKDRKRSRFCPGICSKEVLRVAAFSLLFLGIGAAIGHVSVRITTTSSAFYQKAEIGSEYTTRFLVVGDWGREGQYHQKEVALQMALVGEIFRPNFVISTGDNFYPSGLKRVNDTAVSRTFTDIYHYPSLQVPWYAVLGNHDYGDDSDKHDFSTRPDLQSSVWMQPLDERWICCGGRDFVRASPANITGDDSDMLELFFVDTSPFVHEYYGEPWAAVSGGILDQKDKTKAKIADLDVALERSLAKWKIVVGHQPVRSNGRHGDTSELLAVLPNLLNRRKVSFYLAGHEHDLQDLSEPSNDFLRYVVSGAGSRTRLESGMGHNIKNFFSTYAGFTTIALSETTARVQFWFYDGTMAYEYYAEAYG